MALTSSQRQAVEDEAVSFDITPARVADVLWAMGPDERKDWADFFEELGLDAHYDDSGKHSGDSGSTGNITVAT